MIGDKAVITITETEVNDLDITIVFDPPATKDRESIAIGAAMEMVKALGSLFDSVEPKAG
jgi:hypothetical protein